MLKEGAMPYVHFGSVLMEVAKGVSAPPPNVKKKMYANP